MAVEIEIEGGIQVAAPLIQQSVVALRAQFMDQDQDFLYLTNGSLFGGAAIAYRIHKNTFTAAPDSLLLSTATDVPRGIVQEGAFIYVVAQAATDDVIVYRISKSDFTTQVRFDAGAGIKFPGVDCFSDGSFIVFGNNTGPTFGVVRFEIATNAFTVVSNAENINCNSVRDDVLNGEYYAFSTTSGGCTPAVQIVNKAAFTFTALGGPGICTNPGILVPYRWTPFNAVAVFQAGGLLDSTNQAAYGRIDVGNLLARQANRIGRGASAFTSIGFPVAGSPNNSNVWQEESGTAGSVFYLANNQTPITVARIAKSPLALQAGFVLGGGFGNANSMRIDAPPWPNQFFYVLALTGQVVIRFSKMFLL